MDDCVEGFKLAAGKVSPIFPSGDDLRAYGRDCFDELGRLTSLEKIRVNAQDDSTLYYVKCWTRKSGQFRAPRVTFDDDAPVMSWDEEGFRRIMKHRLGMSRTLEPWTITVLILQYSDQNFTTPQFPCRKLRELLEKMSNRGNE